MKTSHLMGIPEKLDPGLMTRYPCMGRETQDPPLETRDRVHLHGTRDLGHLTRDPLPASLYVGPYYTATSPLICWDWFLYDWDLHHERVN